MGMSALYGPADEAESIATIQEALDAGVTLLDTGDYYGAGHNELLIGDALGGRAREQAVLSVKFGVLRSPSGEILGLDGRPAAVKNALGYTLTRLGTDYVDVYRLGRLDPAVPIEETVGAIAAHSRYYSEDAYERAAEPKELYVVPNAGHVDLYDKTDLIPFDKLEAFFTENLAPGARVGEALVASAV
jgi:fermentation-respiration switch protein FrsA (DUF1100 family)